jgi:hypothetical protein
MNIVYRDETGSKETFLFDAAVYDDGDHIHVGPSVIYHRGRRYDMAEHQVVPGRALWFNPTTGKYCTQREAGVGSHCLVWFPNATTAVVLRYRLVVPVVKRKKGFFSRLFRRGE